jgi:hypothetical protein
VVSSADQLNVSKIANARLISFVIKLRLLRYFSNFIMSLNLPICLNRKILPPGQNTQPFGSPAEALLDLKEKSRLNCSNLERNRCSTAGLSLDHFR